MLIFNKSIFGLLTLSSKSRHSINKISDYGLTLKKQGNFLMKKKSQLIAKLTPICFFSLVAWGAVSHAAVVPTTSVIGGPSVNTVNGVQVVDINKAGNGGVSHNIYTQFNVDKNGVVLNNSGVGVNTSLAGAINGNANLAGGSASIILNEVNSNKASQLSGMMEVAGQQAQVIVANPAGITCSGCGFINTSRATLTTGKAQVANGSLLGYTVEKGVIIINGNGLESSNANYTDIISRSAQITGEIKAQDLKVTLGRNNVNATNTQISALTPSGSTPSVGLDVAKLGGMYANKITLVSTDRGVGVRNSGTIAAAAGDVSITTDGMVENKGTLRAANDVNIETTYGRKGMYSYYYYYGNGYALNNSANGVISAGKNINIDIAKNKLSNGGGSLVANNDINVVSGDVDNRSGIIQAKGIVDLRRDPYYYGYGRTLSNAGGLIEGSKGVVLSSYNLDNTSGVIRSKTGGVDIKTYGYQLNNTKGTIEGCCDINIEGGTLTNTSGLIQSMGDINITTNRNTLNNNKGAIRAENNVTINSGSLNNASGRIQALNYLDVNTNGGTITNNGRITDTQDAGLFSGTGGMTLVASTINNNGGQITSVGNVVTNTSSSLNNYNGIIESEKDNVVITTRSLDNRNNGKIMSAHDTVINASSVSNSGGNINAQGQATLAMSGSYSHYGTLSGKDGVNILADKGTVYNYGTLASSAGTTTISARNFSNQRNAVIDSPAGVQVVLGSPGSFSNYGTIKGDIKLYP